MTELDSTFWFLTSAFSLFSGMNLNFLGPTTTNIGFLRNPSGSLICLSMSISLYNWTYTVDIIGSAKTHFLPSFCDNNWWRWGYVNWRARATYDVILEVLFCVKYTIMTSQDNALLVKSSWKFHFWRENSKSLAERDLILPVSIE